MLPPAASGLPELAEHSCDLAPAPVRLITFAEAPAPCSKAPRQVREALNDFHASNYTSCLSHLESLRWGGSRRHALPKLALP